MLKDWAFFCTSVPESTMLHRAPSFLAVDLLQVQLTLQLEEDDVPAVLKGLQNEATRLRVIGRDGSALERLAAQIEAATVRKPVQRETARKRKQRQA